MTGRRDQLSNAWTEVLIYFGLAEDPRLTAQQRRRRDLFWAVAGPVTVVAFAWSVFGSAVGTIAILVMVPFFVVGVRDVLSGRAAARNADRRKPAG